MLNAVLNMDTGKLMEMKHLLAIQSTRRNQIDRDSIEYQQGWHGRPPNKHTLHPTNPLIHINKMKEGMLNGTISSVVSDTSATLSAFLKKDPSHATGKLSTTVFHLPDGVIAPAMTRNKFLHNVRESARSINIVPALVKYSLLSTNKFCLGRIHRHL
jgi:hypothetical protein